ncbi:MAG: hypothetical protein IJW53_03270 [Clostridia bacterium]|nr:hypothetical protein [Clostridia bacterium]
MPVGKNALKRVTNNGYSKVNTSAPDMEHSVVTEPETEAKPEVKAEPKKAATVKAEPKKNTAPKEKKPAAKKPAVKKAEPKVEEDSHPDGFVRYGLGEGLPVHLL